MLTLYFQTERALSAIINFSIATLLSKEWENDSDKSKELHQRKIKGKDKRERKAEKRIRTKTVRERESYCDQFQQRTKKEPRRRVLSKEMRQQGVSPKVNGSPVQ